MYTIEDIDALLSDELRQAVENNIARPHLDVAMDKRVPSSSLVASQIKYLHRAKDKLPSYYRERCVIPSLAFEQSSSEQVAYARNLDGDRCLDLTCGLGVDAYALSKKFRSVITLEADPVLAYLARRNFQLLGADNIEVVNMRAEEYINSQVDNHFDLVFADPDRRSGTGKKMVCIEDCSPNMLDLMERLLVLSPRVMIKLSPLFDVREAFRVFGENVSVEVVSSKRECKEVSVLIDQHSADGSITAHALGRGVVTFAANDVFPICNAQADRTEVIHTETVHGKKDVLIKRVAELCGKCVHHDTGTYSDGVSNYRSNLYLIAPDVALVKAGIARRYFEDMGMLIEKNESYAYTDVLPQNILGTVFEIEDCLAYSARHLKRIFKERGVRNANLIKADFPLSVNEILKELGLKEGGEEWIAFTSINKKRVALMLRRLG